MLQVFKNRYNAFKQVDKSTIKGCEEIEKYIGNNPTFCMSMGKIHEASQEERELGVECIYNNFINSFANNWADLSNPLILKSFEKALKSNLNLAVSRNGSGDVVVAVDDEYNILSINCNGVSITCRAVENNSQSIIAVVSDVIDFTKQSLSEEDFKKVYPENEDKSNGVECVIYNRNNNQIECNTLEKQFKNNNSSDIILGAFTLTQESYEVDTQDDFSSYKKVEENITQDSIVYAYYCKGKDGNVNLNNLEGLMYLKNVFKDDLKWAEYCCYLSMPIEKLAQNSEQDFLNS